MLHCRRKEGGAMRSDLSFTDRREQILSYLAVRKKTTRFELAAEFCVSLDTIDRDITYLSGIAPIYTKQGNGGGIYILPEYRS